MVIVKVPDWSVREWEQFAVQWESMLVWGKFCEREGFREGSVLPFLRPTDLRLTMAGIWKLEDKSSESKRKQSTNRPQPPKWRIRPSPLLSNAAITRAFLIAESLAMMYVLSHIFPWAELGVQLSALTSRAFVIPNHPYPQLPSR